MAKLYNWCLKELLGVRRSTCNDVCYLEAGYPSLSQMIKNKQHKFFKKIWAERSSMNDDPLTFTIRLALDSNTPNSRLISQYMTSDVRDYEKDRQELVHNIMGSNSSRRKTYVDINPNFILHEVYNTRHSINETHRTAFTRFRVSGHSLACETGRWNRRGRGRLPLEERLCRCGLVQTEMHVLEHCPYTQHIRQSYDYTTAQDLFSGTRAPDLVCNIIYNILKIYE